jgi:hypothetical protein
MKQKPEWVVAAIPKPLFIPEDIIQTRKAVQSKLEKTHALRFVQIFYDRNPKMNLFRFLGFVQQHHVQLWDEFFSDFKNNWMDTVEKGMVSNNPHFIDYVHPFPVNSSFIMNHYIIDEYVSLIDQYIKENDTDDLYDLEFLHYMRKQLDYECIEDYDMLFCIVKHLIMNADYNPLESKKHFTVKQVHRNDTMVSELDLIWNVINSILPQRQWFNALDRLVENNGVDQIIEIIVEYIQEYAQHHQRPLLSFTDESPLFDALRLGNLSLIQCIVKDCHADVNQENSFHQKPLTLYKCRFTVEQDEVVQFLETHCATESLSLFNDPRMCNDVILHILSFNSSRNDSLSTMLVCRLFYDIMDCEMIWKLSCCTMLNIKFFGLVDSENITWKQVSSMISLHQDFILVDQSLIRPTINVEEIMQLTKLGTKPAKTCDVKDISCVLVKAENGHYEHRDTEIQCKENLAISSAGVVYVTSKRVSSKLWC